MAGLKPKEENIIVRTSSDGIVRKTVREWLLGRPRRYIIVPLFQRRYLWGKEQCRKLFDDGLTASLGKLHDLGTVMVYVSNKNEKVLVDGQQRATTLLILFSSLKKRGGEIGNILFQSDGHPILRPTYHDIKPFVAIMENKKPTGDSNVIQVSQWFDEWTANLTNAGVSRMIVNLLDCFSVLEFTIPQGEDSENLQVVYERMVIRSLGIAKMTFNPSPGIINGVLDLSRNLVLSYYSEEQAIKVYHSMWMPLELLVAEDEPVYSEGAEKRFASRIKYFLKEKQWCLSEMEQKQNIGLYLAFKRYNANENDSGGSDVVNYIIQELMELSF